MSFPTIACVSFFLIPLSALLVAFFILVPLLLSSYQRLKKTQRSACFSEVVILASLLFSLLRFVYLVCIRYSLNYEQYLNGEILRFIVGIALIFLASTIFLPRTYSNFKNWKKTNKSIHFSLMLFFGFLSFYCLSILFLKLIVSGLGIFKV
jgi:hypothetical protein